MTNRSTHSPMARLLLLVGCSLFAWTACTSDPEEKKADGKAKTEKSQKAEKLQVSADVKKAAAVAMTVKRNPKAINKALKDASLTPQQYSDLLIKIASDLDESKAYMQETKKKKKPKKKKPKPGKPKPIKLK